MFLFSSKLFIDNSGDIWYNYIEGNITTIIKEAQMKRVLSLFVVCLIFIGCIGCTNKNLPLETNVPLENYSFYYVKNGNILVEKKHTDSSYFAIMAEWLTFNGIDTQFKLNRVFTYSENPDLMPKTEQNEYTYIWDDDVVFCFLSDFETFINDEDNVLYDQSLDMTLKKNRSIIISNALFSESQ